MIDRDNYLNKLRSSMWNGMVKIITGIKGCGKTCFLFNIFRSYLLSEGVDPKDIIEIQLDRFDSARLRNPINLNDEIMSKISDGRKKYIFIDEIQLVAEIPNPDVEGEKITFYDVLNGLLHYENLDIYVTGSNSKMLSSDILTQFRGRGYQIRVHPLSFSEYYGHVKGDRQKAYSDYLRYGGMPHVADMPDDGSKENYLRDLFSETYIKDIKERYSIERVDVLDQMIDCLCSSIGSLTNPRNIANSVSGKISENTARVYLDYIMDAFLFTEAKRFDVKGRRYFNYPMKYYCEDLGLRNAHMNFRQQEETHMMENLIFNELLIRGFSVDVGVVTINTHDSSGRSVRIAKEVDFIANKGNAKYYIQSAFAFGSDEKKENELDSLKRIGDSFMKIVLRTDTLGKWFDDNGILHMNIIDFLLDEEIVR